MKRQILITLKSLTFDIQMTSLIAHEGITSF